MAFAQAPSHEAPVAEINIIPLCDVLLVLLVVFMMASPALTRTIPMDLPQRGPEVRPPAPVEPIRLQVDAGGDVWWHGELVPTPSLVAMLEAEAGPDPSLRPMLQVTASGDADYQAVATVLAAADGAGLQRVTLRTE